VPVYVANRLGRVAFYSTSRFPIRQHVNVLGDRWSGKITSWRSCFYKVTRKRFVHAIYLQAVDHFLVSGKTNSLWIFSQHFIGKMPDAELYQIAGDKDETIRRRNMLETELGSLKAGEKILES
jgi:hypothetical protein